MVWGLQIFKLYSSAYVQLHCCCCISWDAQALVLAIKKKKLASLASHERNPLFHTEYSYYMELEATQICWPLEHSAKKTVSSRVYHSLCDCVNENIII